MRKSLIMIACSTMLLTACSSKKADDTKSVVEQATPVLEETTPVAEKTSPDLLGTQAAEENQVTDSVETTNPADGSKTDTTNSDITGKVVDYIMNGQENKPAADQISWSKTFLDKVNLNEQYKNYLTDGGAEGDIEKFAAYITEHAPIAENWQEMFQSDLKATYGMDVTKLEDLGDNLYQAYVMNEDKEVPYVVVNARTGYFHG